MKLSEHFNLEELVHSNTAIVHNIDNTPSSEIVNNLGKLARIVLEPIRKEVDSAILITSGFRCEELNKLVGGVTNSDHCLGLAVDINALGFTNEELYTRILAMEDFIYGQCILENLDSRKWVHISYGIKRENMRTDSRDARGNAIYVHV